MRHLSNALGAIPQTEQARPEQVPNNAGGYTFQLNKFSYLHRFLVIGTEGGTYYVAERKLTADNLANVKACIAEDGVKAVDMIVDVSVRGAAAKNDYAIFALALAGAYGSVETKRYAFSKLDQVCRIGTHLFQFADYISKMRGWGRLLTDSIANWYLSKAPAQLAYQVVKYQSRAIEGQPAWSHDDLLRKCHAKAPAGTDLELVFRWITETWVVGTDGNAVVSRISNLDAIHADKTHKTQPVREDYTVVIPSDLRIIQGYELAKHEKDPAKVARLIKDYGLTHEMIPTEVKTSAVVWEALLEKMPLTAMVRNLGNMSKAGILGPLSAGERKVRDTLGCRETLSKAKIHPLNLLSAYATYGSGKGFRGSNTWTVNKVVEQAVEDAFYLSFDYVEPTNKRHFIGQDISGSMGMGSGNLGLTCAQISAVLTMVTVKREPYLFYGGFNNQLTPLNVTASMRLKEVLDASGRWCGGSTDCSAPMVYAEQQKMPVDAFCVYTDNETYAGSVHPHTALQQYRDAMGINAKLVVVGITATNFTIADPKDLGMMDVVGFDLATPAAISSFVR
jgi:60 kDa SS-A/Ro ribonucleoprotein